MNILFLRVSKEEKDLQDIESQQTAIIEKFDLYKKPLTVLQERISAYDLNKISKRKAFLRVLYLLFDSDTTTIEDIFLGRYTKKEINFYVWDYHRIIRRYEYNLLFGILIDFFDINIYSYKQGTIKRKDLETPLEKFSRSIFYSINAFSSEDYSYNISTNVKKVVSKDRGITVSSKGNKWGKYFCNSLGEKVKLSPDQTIELNRLIKKFIKYYKKKNIVPLYPKVIERIIKELDIKVSKAYLTKINSMKNERIKPSSDNI